MLNGNRMVPQLLKSRLPSVPRREQSEVEGGRIVGCGYFPPPLGTVGWAWGYLQAPPQSRVSCTIPHSCSEELGTLLSPGLLRTGAGLTLSTLQGVLNSRGSLILQIKRWSQKGGEPCLEHTALCVCVCVCRGGGGHCSLGLACFSFMLQCLGARAGLLL